MKKTDLGNFRKTGTRFLAICENVRNARRNVEQVMDSLLIVTYEVPLSSPKSKPARSSALLNVTDEASEMAESVYNELIKLEEALDPYCNQICLRLDGVLLDRLDS